MAVDDDVMRIDRALSELMRLTMSQRVHEARAEATGVPLSRTQLRVLGAVEDRGSVSVSRLAGLLDVSQPTASRSLLQLEQSGLVRRLADPSDGRIVVYGVTPEGRRTRRKVRDHMRRRLSEALDGMPQKRRAQLSVLLEDFVERLYASGRDGDPDTG